MAIVTEPIPAQLVKPPPRALLRRPTSPKGVWGWMTTIDHKKIGLLYIATAFGFFIVGGIEALILRMQLGGPNGHVVSADVQPDLHHARHHHDLPGDHAA